MDSDIDRTKLGSSMKSELTKPTLTPSHLIPEHALNQAYFHDAKCPEAGQREDLAVPNLVHRLEGGHNDHVKRHAEKQRGHHQEDKNRNLVRSDPSTPPRPANRDDRRDSSGRGIAHPAFLLLTTADRRKGKNKTTVKSSIIVAAAEAYPRFSLSQYALIAKYAGTKELPPGPPFVIATTMS